MRDTSSAQKAIRFAQLFRVILSVAKHVSVMLDPRQDLIPVARNSVGVGMWIIGLVEINAILPSPERTSKVGTLLHVLALELPQLSM